MKHGLTALCLAAIAGISSPAARSEDVDAPPPAAKIRVDVQMVSIPVTEAGRLVPAFQNRKTAGDAWTRLQALITNGEATLMAWPVVWVQNGERGHFESIAEERWPAKMSPPHPPQPMPPSPKLVQATWGPFTPDAFETRDTGATFEARVTTRKNGKVIALDITAQYLRRIATREWHTQADPAGVSGVRQEPEFLTSQVTTSLDVRHDEPALVGSFVVAEPQPHVELFILHAKATLLPASAFPPHSR